MISDVESSSRRIPTLVQYCQRVASTHVDSISSLGDELRYQLVKPILESCSPEQLLRLEQVSPHLQKGTPEIWKDMCVRTYPVATEPYILGTIEEPESWKDLYFILRKAEAERFEEVGSRLRTQRHEANERKKEREVKLTDRVPVAKRPRTGWSTNTQPKTLFQKTRSEASKIQKNIYHARMIPPMPNGKSFRVLPNAPSASLPPVPSSSLPSRVTVNTVIRRRPLTKTPTPSTRVTGAPLSSTASPLSLHKPPSETATSSSSSAVSSTTLSRITVASSPTPTGQRRLTNGTSPSAPVDSLDSPSPPLVKKDRMATIFMPRHRAYSQRPG